MDIIHNIDDFRSARQQVASVAFVPTMGNLHEGHTHLIRMAGELKKQGLVDAVVASIFVNRLQFAPHEDFDTYPRTLEADAEKLQANGCDIVFAPNEEQLYPEPQQFHVTPPAEMDDILEGHYRPGFFRGVCTVVHKLFNIVQPQHAIFGKKDFQQLAILRRMVQHMALPITVHGADIVRDAHGLALSSRNGYFNAEQLVKARELNAVLRQTIASLSTLTAADTIATYKNLEEEAEQQLTTQGWKVDYIAIRDSLTLQPASTTTQELSVLAAATIHNVRLIDNIQVNVNRT